MKNSVSISSVPFASLGTPCHFTSTSRFSASKSSSKSRVWRRAKQILVDHLFPGPHFRSDQSAIPIREEYRLDGVAASLKETNRFRDPLSADGIDRVVGAARDQSEKRGERRRGVSEFSERRRQSGSLRDANQSVRHYAEKQAKREGDQQAGGTAPERRAALAHDSVQAVQVPVAQSCVNDQIDKKNAKQQRSEHGMIQWHGRVRWIHALDAERADNQNDACDPGQTPEGAPHPI